ncbi:DUF1178 family protein [Sphingorhabdus sp. Alg239-R122]|uniref:DUF1178 family protein n=1 Tax=Sphingorhabdus sp. Alg239-R122 TaxID=2305989 RepID=UPI0013DC66E0|nr:DUF1178 family protein [Sphingorhabdus sp. Alg239-R122]
MIVFDLVCRSGGHVFEGWFASSEAFAEQKRTGLLCCPTCGDHDIQKAVMAPNVGAKGNQVQEVVATASAAGSQVEAPATEDAVAMQNVPEINQKMQDMIGALAKAQSQMLEKSTWVGSDFARRARDIHYGEVEQELIHGETSEEEAQDLIDEGISVAPLPLPVVPPEAKN